MTLHLIRLDPDAYAAARWFAGEKLAPDDTDEGYRWHALLCATFGKALAPKPFRILARRGRPVQILAYTTQPEAMEAAARDFADPQALGALGLAEQGLASKPMPEFAEGRRLGFSVLTRPSMRTDRGGDRTKTAEIDVYVPALNQSVTQGAPKPDRAKVYADWGQAKLEAGGARVVNIRLDGMERDPVKRRGADRAFRQVEGHAAVLAGVIEIADATAFGALLARGVGRQRAFGYGMLLLSPG